MSFGGLESFGGWCSLNPCTWEHVLCTGSCLSHAREETPLCRPVRFRPQQEKCSPCLISSARAVDIDQEGALSDPIGSFPTQRLLIRVWELNLLSCMGWRLIFRWLVNVLSAQDPHTCKWEWPGVWVGHTCPHTCLSSITVIPLKTLLPKEGGRC